MTLLDLIRKETEGTRRDIVVVAAISAVANGALLAIVNASVQRGYGAGESLRTLALFVISFALYAVCFRRTLFKTTTVLEDILLRIRLRITEKIREADLASLERTNEGEVFTLLTSQARFISESGTILATALQSLILLVFASLYLAYLSLPAFLFCVALMGLVVPLYTSRLKGATGSMERTVGQEAETFNAIRHLLDGFKEVKLNRTRAADVVDDIREQAMRLRELKLRTADMFNMNYIAAYGGFYAMMGAVMFVLPHFVSLDHADLVKVMMTVMFIIGPLSMVISGVQALSKANVAVANMTRLEEQLDQAIRTLPRAASPVPVPVDFRRLRLEAVGFRYLDRDGATAFSIGPVDLEIRRGEIVFVMGGNGSGKTTLIKVLTGLYLASSGRILVDDVEITLAELPAYHELFSAVFSDFYLFPKLYGLRDVDPDRVRAMLRKFGLAGKTDYVDGQFTNLDLSTGQRKRLAMIVALLEDRPVYIFDEWAAEQDPQFRRYYYEELLPELSRAGKTILAVTHDDRYMATAHRVVKMELGVIDRIDEHRRFGEEPTG